MKMNRLKSNASIEDLEAKMKKIYDDNRVLIEGEYTVGKES